MSLIQEIGAYAGLVALPAVLLLAALCFSQARDLRRLREWAGRAPERDAAAARQRHALGSPATPMSPRTAPVEAPAPVQPAPAVPPQAPAEPGRGHGVPPRTASAQAATAVATRPAPAAPRVSRPRPVTPERKPAPPVGDQLRRFAPFAAGALALLAIAAFVLSQLGGGSTPSRPAAARTQAATLAPSQVNVAVLNGAGIPGLGARYGARLRSAGFGLGPVGNAPPSQRTSVRYAPGAEAQAALVERSVGVAGGGPADSSLEGQAGGAPVILVVGADGAGPKQ